MKNQRCEVCGLGLLRPTVRKVVRKFGDRIFDAELPGKKCSHCGELQIGIGALLEWDKAVIRALAAFGPVDGSAFKFLRSAACLQAKELAELLGVTAGTVSRWEHGRPIDRASWITIATLAFEHAEGRTDTLDRLRALAKPLRKHIHLKIAA